MAGDVDFLHHVRRGRFPTAGDLIRCHNIDGGDDIVTFGKLFDYMF